MVIHINKIDNSFTSLFLIVLYVCGNKDNAIEIEPTMPIILIDNIYLNEWLMCII